MQLRATVAERFRNTSNVSGDTLTKFGVLHYRLLNRVAAVCAQTRMTGFLMAGAVTVALPDAVATRTIVAPKRSKKLLVIGVGVILLLATAGGLWFTGILPSLLGLAHEPAAEHGDHAAAATGPHVPVFAELPEMVANLNAPGRRALFIKVKVRVELARAEDVAGFVAAQPRVIDLFQTYLREMRPEELRGSAGTYRLREQLITRANIAIAPARVVDVLFNELLVQ